MNGADIRYFLKLKDRVRGLGGDISPTSDSQCFIIKLFNHEYTFDTLSECDAFAYGGEAVLRDLDLLKTEKDLK